MMKAFRKTRYRATQFFSSVKPTFSLEDWALVDRVLGKNGQALALFYQMNPADQRHSLAVLKTLLSWGEDHPALYQAALLHDSAKAMGQPLFHRVVIVLLKTLCPPLLAKLAAAPLGCARWRRPFVVHASHPQIGADWAEKAHCPPLTVSLIKMHQQKPTPQPQNLSEHLHLALYKADGMN